MGPREPLHPAVSSPPANANERGDAMRHRRTWLLTRWTKKTRETRAAAAAQALQEEERRAARARILSMATTLLPTVPSARTAPLLTRGQADRTRPL